MQKRHFRDNQSYVLSSICSNTSCRIDLEIKEVRFELVQKYVSAGKSTQYAEEEVDKFLSDPDRSEKYLEMRRYAKAQADELMGFETVFIIGGAFFLGLMGNVGVKYFLAYKVSQGTCTFVLFLLANEYFTFSNPKP